MKFYLGLLFCIVSGTSFADACSETMESKAVAFAEDKVGQEVKVVKHIGGAWTEAVANNTGSSEIHVKSQDGRQFAFKVTAKQIGRSSACEVLTITEIPVASPGGAASLKLKKELLSSILNADGLSGDNCSVFAKIENGELEITFEEFGPAEAIIFQSKSTDIVSKKFGGTDASPSTLYTFSQNGVKVAVIEVVGFEDLANTEFNLYNSSNKLVRSCLYQE
jgi:hypothetical protein